MFSKHFAFLKEIEIILDPVTFPFLTELVTLFKCAAI